MHFLFSSTISATLKISVIDSLLIGAIAYIFLLPFVRKKNAKMRLWLLFAVMYGSFLLFLTIPVVLEPYPAALIDKIRFVSRDIIWNPFESITGIQCVTDFITLIFGNFCLLMPMSILVLVKNRGCRFGRFVAVPVAVSLGIELAQFAGNVLIGYSNRTVELLDVLLNVAGALLCFGCFKMLMRRNCASSNKA